jgi:lipoprotein NlpI
MADLGAIWTYIPACEAPCRGVESVVQQLEHHFLAVMIYSGIVAVITATVVRKEYFDKLFHKLRAHGVDTDGAKDVWRFTFAIFLFNATLHALQLADESFASFLMLAPLSRFGWLGWFTVFRIVYLLGNIGLWLWAAILYKQDAARVKLSNPEIDKEALFEKRKALLIAYFTPVALLFAFDDTLSKNWELFKATERLHSLLDIFKTLHGWLVPITLIVFTLVAVATVVVAMFYQERVRDIGWRILVYSIPFAVPIASVLLIGTGIFAFFVSGGDNNAAASASMQSVASVQGAAASQGAASVQSAPPAQSMAPVQAAASVQSSAPARSETPAKDDDDHHAVADHTQANQIDPKNKIEYNARGLAYNAKGDYDRAIADFSEAIRLDPKYALAYNNRCLSRSNKGESDLALADCNEAIRLDPKFTSAYINRGIASFYAGLLPMALADFNQWSQFDPKNAYAALWLDIVGRRGNLPSRLADATKKIDMNKWPAPIIQLYLGKLTAEAVLIAADDPNASTKSGRVCEANFFTGELMLQRGKKDEAAQLFRLAAADCPKHFVQYFAANAELKALGIALTSAAR